MLRLTLVPACSIAALLCGCATTSSTPRIPPGKPSSTEPVVVGTGVPKGEPTRISIEAPVSIRTAGGRRLVEFERGRSVAAQSGCLACHRIGDTGNTGPGPDLTEVGDRLPRRAIEVTLMRPIGVMPSFRHLSKTRLRALVEFLSYLRG